MSTGACGHLIWSIPSELQCLQVATEFDWTHSLHNLSRAFIQYLNSRTEKCHGAGFSAMEKPDVIHNRFPIRLHGQNIYQQITSSLSHCLSNFLSKSKKRVKFGHYPFIRSRGTNLLIYYLSIIKWFVYVLDTSWADSWNKSSICTNNTDVMDDLLHYK